MRKMLLFYRKFIKMPAILIEAAFMTNLEEAKLLASDKFREEVAEEIYKGICVYYGLQS